MPRLCRHILLMLLALLCACQAAFAQGSVNERTEALVTLSETDIPAALQAMQALRKQLEPSVPYTHQRRYWHALIGMQIDAAQLDAAKDSIATLQDMARLAKDPVGEILADLDSAYLRFMAGQANAALVQLQALESRAVGTANEEVLWHFYISLASVQQTLGQFEASLENAFKAQQYGKLRPYHAQASHVRSLNMRALVYMGMANWEKALQVLEEAIPLADQAGLTKVKGTLYLNQGAVLASMGRAKGSVDAYQKALSIAKEAGVIGLEATALNNLGDTYLIAKNYPQAEAYARLAMAKYEKSGEHGGYVVARSNLGFALMGQGKIAQGAAEVRTALAGARQAGAKADEEGILGELSHMYEQAGLYREAVTTIREQQVLSAQLFRADREKTVASMQEQFDTVQRQKQIELLARENSLKDAEIANRRLQQMVTLLAAVLTVVAGGFVYQLYRRVRKTNAKLREVNQQLEFHAVRDPLTGLYNRRSFFDLMQKRASPKAGDRRDDNQPDGLMILDIDHFKHINDTLGHAGGDAVLVEIAKRLRATVRESDLVMRWGGEEFLIFSPKASIEHLQVLAQRLLKAIGSTPMEVAGAPMTVTATGGFLTLPFSGLPESVCNWEKAVLIADMALYLGKVNGRNRAYGLGRLLVPAEQAMPVLERDLSAALKAQMVELREVLGPVSRVAEPASV